MRVHGTERLGNRGPQRPRCHLALKEFVYVERNGSRQSLMRDYRYFVLDALLDRQAARDFSSGLALTHLRCTQMTRRRCSALCSFPTTATDTAVSCSSRSVTRRRCMSQGTSVIVARPADSSDVTVKVHMAVDDHAEAFQLRRDW